MHANLLIYAQARRPNSKNKRMESFKQLNNRSFPFWNNNFICSAESSENIFFFQNILLVKVAKHAENILKYNMYSII